MTNSITIRFNTQAHFGLVIDNGFNIVGDHPAYIGMTLSEFVEGVPQTPLCLATDSATSVEAIAAPAELLSELEGMFPELSIEQLD